MDGAVGKEEVNSRLLLAKYENDRLEQCTRGENIRVGVLKGKRKMD